MKSSIMRLILIIHEGLAGARGLYKLCMPQLNIFQFITFAFVKGAIY